MMKTKLEKIENEKKALEEHNELNEAKHQEELQEV